MPGSTALRPRPHQIDALADLTRAFAVTDRAQLIMPCGSGKSLVARWHAEASSSRLTIVLVPSLALVAQTLAEWRRANGGWRFEALVVCSDPTTASGVAERAEDADTKQYGNGAAFWRTQQATVTTDHQIVMRFLTRTRTRPTVIFATYHSAPVIAHAQAATRTRADLLVADEAHRLAGRPRQEFRCALEARQLLADRRLFMTATPLHADSDSEDGDGDCVNFDAPGTAGGGLGEPVSMSDETLFGPVAHHVSFGDAIAAGLLTDYRALVVASRTGSGDPDPLEAAPAALLDAANRHGITRVLSYHGRVVKASAFAEQVDGLSTADGRVVRARCVHGRLNTRTRREILRWLGEDCPGEVRVVTNAKCLVEGVDVPAVDGILFADPRNSIVDVVQAVGRVLRAAPGKQHGTIIIPVALPTGGDEDTELALSSYGLVWAVVRGLRHHDERLADELDTSRRAYARSSEYRMANPPSRRIQFVLPADVAGEPIHLRLLESTSSTWERFYGLLEAYAWRTSGALLPRSHFEQGVHIGEWAERQRQAHRMGRLPAGRRDRLEQVPGWAWDRDDAMWRASYDIAATFAAVNGGMVEHDYGLSRFDGVTDAERRPLGRWLARQRQAHRDGTLDPARAQALTELPGWTWTPVPDTDLAMVDALRSFVEWEKHAAVPDRHVEDDLPLGAWCWTVRRRRLTGRLSPALLDAITVATPPHDKSRHKSASIFRWEVDEAQWRLSLSALRAYAAREGHARVPTTHTETLPDATVRLGMWVAKQRYDHKRGLLDERKARALAALPGWLWDASDTGKAYGDPIDIGPHRHGSASGAQAKCPCEPCVEYSRDRTRVWQARRKQLVDGVPAAGALAHITRVLDELARLTDAGGGGQRPPGVDAIAVAANVPVGVVRSVSAGRCDVLRQRHEVALLAVTAQAVLALYDTAGSRGRRVMSAQEKIPAAPSRALLDELAGLGWPRIWVANELGYDRKVGIGAQTVTRRVADAIAELHARIGGRRAPAVASRQHLDPLAQLERDGRIPARLRSHAA